MALKADVESARDCYALVAGFADASRPLNKPASLAANDELSRSPRLPCRLPRRGTSCGSQFILCCDTFQVLAR